jgi:hypothetical protein
LNQLNLTSNHFQKLSFLITIYNNNPYKDLRSQLADLQADLNAYLGRGARNAISDRMKFKILTSLTKNHLTVRQIESEIGDMIENVEYFQKFPKISRNPIHKVSYAIPSLNVRHSVAFLNSSQQLWYGFDGSTKLSKSIQAVVIINEVGESHCLESFESADGTSDVLANSFGQIFDDLALAGTEEGLFEVAPEVWSKKQASKIVMIMSDSCAGAQRTKKLLSGVIRDMAGNQDMVIFEGF